MLSVIMTNVVAPESVLSNFRISRKILLGYSGLPRETLWLSSLKSQSHTLIFNLALKHLYLLDYMLL
jgi:hypothetical protein